MTLAVLEFNDQRLQIKSDDGLFHSETGFAYLHSQGIETGEEARSKAWQQTQNSYNQYWAQLNQTPLAAKQDWARHHADIAYAQLKNIWTEAGSPESVMLLIPGCFDDMQVSLLLGMVAALPTKISAVIDSALVSHLASDEDVIYLDMQLHQSVMTLCRSEGNSTHIADQEVFPDFGMIQIQNSVARHISRLLIDSSRYDPMHASASEQDIFNRIPEWLSRLRWEKELSATINSEHGELPFILRNDVVSDLVAERLANVKSFINRHSTARVVLSPVSEILAGLVSEFSDAEVSDSSAVLDYCLANEDTITGQSDGLVKMRSLVHSNRKSARQKPKQIIATHILHEDQALPLSRPVSIALNGQGLRISNSLDKNALLTVVQKNTQLEVLRKDNTIESLIPVECLAGGTITIGGHEFRLIRVQHES